jgi:hypothetical protein
VKVGDKVMTPKFTVGQKVKHADGRGGFVCSLGAPPDVVRVYFGDQLPHVFHDDCEPVNVVRLADATPVLHYEKLRRLTPPQQVFLLQLHDAGKAWATGQHFRTAQKLVQLGYTRQHEDGFFVKLFNIDLPNSETSA